MITNESKTSDIQEEPFDSCGLTSQFNHVSLNLDAGEQDNAY